MRVNIDKVVIRDQVTKNGRVGVIMKDQWIDVIMIKYKIFQIIVSHLS